MRLGQTATPLLTSLPIHSNRLWSRSFGNSIFCFNYWRNKALDLTGKSSALTEQYAKSRTKHQWPSKATLRAKEPTVLLQPNANAWALWAKWQKPLKRKRACHHVKDRLAGPLSSPLSLSSFFFSPFFRLSGRFPDLKRRVYFRDSETQMNAQTKGVSGSSKSSLEFKTQRHKPNLAPIPWTSWKLSHCLCSASHIQHADPPLCCVCWPCTSGLQIFVGIAPGLSRFFLEK